MTILFRLIVLISSVILLSCGLPNDPESLIGDSGGYKIVSKLPVTASAQDVIVQDTLAFLAQGEGGLLVVNISDHKNPEIISLVTGRLRGYSYKIAKKDSVVYLAAGNFGISAVDVANPLLPVVGASNMPLKPAKDFCVMGNFLFTAISEEGIKISEISYPTQPDIRGGMLSPGFARGLTVSVDSNYLLVACGEMGLAVFDISELQGGFGNYPLEGWIDTEGYSEHVVIHPTLPYAFVTCGDAGIAIADFSDPTDVNIVSTFPTGDYAKEVFYKDNKLYISAGRRGLYVLNVSNINSPTLIGNVETSDALGISVDDQYVYIADSEEGLIIISIP